MAVRARQKGSKQRASRRSSGSGSIAVPSQSIEWYATRLKAAEGERDRLKAQLQEALERIARLEENRTETVNRIDWVIDSLHNVLENGA